MGWSIGWDPKWQRDIGYGVPATCDFPACFASIDRGLAYVCGGEPYGGEHGCGLFFCEKHLLHTQLGVFDGPFVSLCEQCHYDRPSFAPTPDVREWLEWKLTDESWAKWRDDSPNEVARATATLADADL